MTNFTDVGEFHEKFGLPVSTGIGAGHLPADVAHFRINFLREELAEYIFANSIGDLHGMFDALLDLVYVAMGTAHFHGFDWEAGWDEVQRANMAKVRAESADQSKRGSAFDVVKPDGWTPPILPL